LGGAKDQLVQANAPKVCFGSIPSTVGSGMSLKDSVRIAAQRFASYLAEPTISQVRKDLERLTWLKDDEDCHPLRICGRRHFSQNDEDGILLEILRRLDIFDARSFLEFGVGDGTENNTIILLAKKWRGAWVGGESLAFDVPREASRLVFLKSWITKDNAADLAEEALAQSGIDLSSVSVVCVDLDGNDGSIVRSLLQRGASPEIFVVEYNAKFPPSVEFEMPYDESHTWRPGFDFFGVSLLSWVKTFEPAGYSLVACNRNGVNAFFVKTSAMERFADVPKAIEGHYRPGTYLECPASGHRTDARTVALLAAMK
jgi:hypothetical protein